MGGDTHKTLYRSHRLFQLDCNRSKIRFQLSSLGMPYRRLEILFKSVKNSSLYAYDNGQQHRVHTGYTNWIVTDQRYVSSLVRWVRLTDACRFCLYPSKTQAYMLLTSAIITGFCHTKRFAKYDNWILLFLKILLYRSVLELYAAL